MTRRKPPQYLADCPQLPAVLVSLLDGRKKRRPNVLHRIVLALHLRDCMRDVRAAREAFVASGGEVAEE